MRNWHRNRYAKVPHNDRFRNLWRPKKRHARQRRLEESLLQARACRTFTSVEPEQALYVSDAEQGEMSSARATPQDKTDMTGITSLGTKQVAIAFEPLWDEDGKCKDHEDYKKRLGDKHPVLTQRVGWKKMTCMDWCRDNPNEERWIESGSGYFQSNVPHAASYTGNKTNVQALAAHLKREGKGANNPEIAKLYCTGQAKITVNGYVCRDASVQHVEDESEEEGGWGGDAIDDDDAAASDGEAREESNFDDGDDQHVDEDGEVPLFHGESGEPTSPTPSPTPSSTASDDDAETEDALIAEARKYPSLKRKADELENELDALRQNIKVEKAKEAAAQAAEKEVIRRIWSKVPSPPSVSVDTYDKNKCGLYFNTPHLVEGGAFTKLREDAFNGKLGQTVRGWEARAREHGNGEMGYENLHWVPDPDPHDDQVKEECFLKKAEEYALLLLTEQGYKRTGPTHEDFTFPTAEERKTKTLEAMEKAMRVMCEQRQQ